MNKFSIFTILVLWIFLVSSCSTTKSKSFDEDTASHQRIAVVPFKAKLKLTEKQKENVTTAEIKNMELEQGKDVQNAVEFYLIGKKMKVTVQSASMTNSKLSDARINFEQINDHDATKLCQILGVDAIVSGYIETEKPMSEELATGLDIAKGLETSLIGTSFGSAVNTSTNRGRCQVSLFNGTNGDRLWSYSEDLELQKGSTTQDIISALMRRGARKFPYKKK